MAFFKKHARFLIVLVVLLALLYFVGNELADSNKRLAAARANADRLLKQNYTALFKDSRDFGGAPATVQGRKIQDKTQNLQQVEAGRNALLAFETDPAFTVAALPQGSKDDDLVAYYARKLLDMQREFAYLRYFIPDVHSPDAFGFKAATGDGTKPPAGAQVPDMLRKLDIVRAVAGSVGRSGVARLNKLAFRELANELSARSLPVQPSAEGEAPYLRGQGLEIDVSANEDALYNLLNDLQRPMKGELRTRYLSVERFKLEKPDLLDPADDLVKATITVAAWQVNETSSYPVDRNAPEQQQSSTRAPRAFR